MRLVTFVFAIVILGLAIGPTLTAQQQQPLVVQAANSNASTSAATAKPAAAAADDATVQAAIKALQNAKKANDELLKKQEATLQQLDELQKGAEQLKIFSKRG